MLWDNLITNALVPEEREACFAWLEKSSANKPDGFVVRRLLHIYTVYLYIFILIPRQRKYNLR